MRRRAFTLVELLVVIGIIAVLIAILMPVLNRARESANQIKCLSNLRQIGIAITAYTNENKGFFPSCTADPVAPRPEDWVWWQAARNPNNMNYAMGSVIPYLGGQQVPSLGGIVIPAAVLRCPSDDIQSHRTPYPYSYSLNILICRQMGPGRTDPNTDGTPVQMKDRPIRLTQVVAPSRKILAIDETAQTIDDGCWNAPDYSMSQDLNCLSVRHDRRDEDVASSGAPFQKNPGRGNVIYCDGHGEFVPRFDCWDVYCYDPFKNPDADNLLLKQ